MTLSGARKYQFTVWWPFRLLPTLFCRNELVSLGSNLYLTAAQVVKSVGFSQNKLLHSASETPLWLLQCCLSRTHRFDGLILDSATFDCLCWGGFSSDAK